MLRDSRKNRNEPSLSSSRAPTVTVEDMAKAVADGKSDVNVRHGNTALRGGAALA